MFAKHFAVRRARQAVRAAVAYQTLPLAFWCPRHQSDLDAAAKAALARAARYA